MSATRATTLFQYYYYDIWNENVADNIREYPMMDGGPWTMLSLVCAYLAFIKYVPPMMKNRQPFDLKSPILLYNLFLVTLNAGFFISSCHFTGFGIHTWRCMPVIGPNDPWGRYKLNIGWLFIVSKFVDFFDTVFFILRKKNNQVSKLHVIHHVLVPINCWIGFKYVPSESAAFMPFINSFVHTLMYGYYALSTMGPAVQPYLWWKKYLTQIQIVQIFLVLMHCVYIATLPGCTLPKIMFWTYFPQTALVLCLFINFFIQSYLKKPEKKNI